MRETIYGRNAVRECLRAGRRRVYKLFVAQGVREKDPVAEIVALTHQVGAVIERVERAALDRIGAVNHQGVVAEVSAYPYADLGEILTRAEERDEPPFLLLLDCLEDPQNLGTLLRTAEVVGVHGVVIPKRRAVGVTPAVAKASAGATEHLLVARVTNLARAIGDLKKKGVWVVGLENLPQARLYSQFDLSGPLALVVGSEGRGIRRLVLASCDVVLRLPVRGHIGSLNAAVAGSIALYEAWRQREGQ
ncbi:MAG TPA: 23S rRNA (guanosine(2251)-2'-O)-methyltransferase RlmB [Anaerolineae bacterium]|nr:23S rRNA (guanosine(2251)-2'-O)-methyltransferase RlmB [Anaerolineae bacterium]